MEVGEDSVAHDANKRLVELTSEFERKLTELAESPGYALPRYQEQLFRVASDLLDVEGGLERLREHAHRLDAARAFRGGPWDDPTRLLPSLVGECLLGEGVTPTVEALSELRMLAVAAGQCHLESTSAEDARRFLREVFAKNLHIAFPAPTERTRARPKLTRRAEALFDLIREETDLRGLREGILEEVEARAAQRPVTTAAIRNIVDRLASIPAVDDDPRVDDRLRQFVTALGPVTERSASAGDVAPYRRLLQTLEHDELVEECRAFSASMHGTGLVSPFHAVALRYVARVAPADVATALGVESVAVTDPEALANLVRSAIFPGTADAILGVAGVLERGLLARNEVAAGLRRLVDLDILPEVRDLLGNDEGIGANSVLVAGALAVLGQPLGVGQGNSPTCQSARGISLWSLHAPGMLLGMIATAARDGYIRAEFEGQEVRSDRLHDGVARGQFDADVDPVSRLLVPHLDRIYSHMMSAVAFRSDDGHRWVNRAMYGHWIPTGFESVFDNLAPRTVHRHREFVKRFIATHHPEYNDGHELIYPNPVGIMVTDVNGGHLGPHAVSLQRIARDESGTMRVYFFNPNNEGRQDWGQGIRPAVSGNGERPGESSLPIEQFASRLYAFHFDPMEEGESYAIPESLVDEISTLAETSWGTSFDWQDRRPNR